MPARSESAATRPIAARAAAIALGVLAIVAVAFAIGRFSAFGASAAPARPAEASAEAGFARDMQVHHGQAVEMAMEIYRETADDELRVLAYDIATAQSGQRGEMFGWLVEWGLPQSDGRPLMAWMAASAEHSHGDTATRTDAELRAEMGMASDAELAELRSAEGSDADCLFLELMIRHHEGALPMAEAVQELGSDSRVDTVAAAIESGQAAEIDAMRSIQNRLACTA